MRVTRFATVIYDFYKSQSARLAEVARIQHDERHLIQAQLYPPCTMRGFFPL
jgi:hypothetical protein